MTNGRPYEAYGNIFREECGGGCPHLPAKQATQLEIGWQTPPLQCEQAKRMV